MSSRNKLDGNDKDAPEAEENGLYSLQIERTESLLSGRPEIKPSTPVSNMRILTYEEVQRRLREGI